MTLEPSETSASLVNDALLCLHFCPPAATSVQNTHLSLHLNELKTEGNLGLQTQLWQFFDFTHSTGIFRHWEHTLKINTA